MRKKVKLAFIENNSARKATFKKRKKGLLKKISELKTLCDIQACAIIYSPYDSRPEVWPSEYGVHQVLSRLTMMPEMEQSKKMLNQQSFLRQRINKAIEQLRKQKKDNLEMEVTQAMFDGLTGQSLIYLNMLDLTELRLIIDRKLIEIIMRIQTLTVNNSYAGEASDAVVENSVAEGGAEGTVVVAEPPVTVGFDVNGESVQRQPWMFTDLVNPPNQFQFGGGAVTGGGEDMLPPFSLQNEDNLWYSEFFRYSGI
ncbi:agamous-like MADS-box protein AGL80 [Euphorbia lathyris]|uniref:agamous-like MADS-box protein AGL80 n=1 Tax=Euphorbia lathyris TaxID=212925 RepID=UPI0033138F7F